MIALWLNNRIYSQKVISLAPSLVAFMWLLLGPWVTVCRHVNHLGI